MPLQRLSRLITGALVAFAVTAQISAEPPIPGSIEKIEHLGVYIDECSLPGERRTDGVVPRHATCIQVAQHRWLALYSTHGYRGVDDERSIIYQLRRDSPDGAIVREGFLSRAIDDWRPDGLAPPAGTTYFKQHGHMTAFGVPKDAIVDGRPAPHANLFVAKWRTLGRPLEVSRNYLHKTSPGSDLERRTRYVEWVQFRLNDAEDDIEIVEPVRMLRQRGFESGVQFTSLDVAWMNQTFCPAVPYSSDYREWVDCNHFDQGRLAVLRYRYSERAARYEWNDASALITLPGVRLSEASLAHAGHEWLIAARTDGRLAWSRATDPLGPWSKPRLDDTVTIAAPLTLFRYGDGVLRLLTGDSKISPHRNGRDPLYCWDVFVDASAQQARIGLRRTIFDSVAAALPIRPQARPKIDFAELFPHQGRTQLIVHAVSTRAYDFPYEGRNDIPAIRADEKRVSGLYCARITYRQSPPALWQFAE